MVGLGKFWRKRRALGLAALTGVLIVAFAPVHGGGFAQAADKKEAAKTEAPKKAGTTADPAVDIGDLKLMLEPLTRTELEIEVDGWWKLLQAKVREVNEAELAVRRRNREIAALAKVQAAAENVAAAAASASQTAGASAGAEAEKAAAAKLERAKAELERASAEPKPQSAKPGAADASPAASPQASASPGQSPAAADKPAATTNIPAASDQAILDRAVQTAEKKAEKTGDDKEVTERAQAAVRETQAAQAVASAAHVNLPSAPTGAASAPDAAPPAQQAQTIAVKVQEAAAAKSEVKVQLIDYATQLGNERTQISDRLKVVLDEWDRKGGDSKDARLYIAAVGGLKVDVTDAASTYTRIKAWLVTEEGGLRLARNLALFMTYISASLVIAWIVRRVLKRMLGRMRHGPSQLLQKFALDMSGRLVVFFGFLAGLSALEINLSPLLAIIGASGFVVAFALQGTLSNFASGLLIMVNKPFDIGDTVDVGGGIQGRVEELNTFSTLIRTPEGISKIVPNNTIWNGVIINETTGVVTPAPAAAAV